MVVIGLISLILGILFYCVYCQ